MKNYHKCLEELITKLNDIEAFLSEGYCKKKWPADPPTPSTLKKAIDVWRASKSLSQPFAKFQLQNAMQGENELAVLVMHNATVGSPI